MIHFLAALVARIYAHNGDVVGAGVLVDEHLVLTCAHVVDDALRLSSNQSLPPHAQVQVDFPLLTEEFKCFATVTHFDMDTDVAGLQLIDPPPRSTRPTRLVSTDSLWRHAFGAVGFPTDYDAGVWASGILLGRTAGGYMQLEDVKVPGYAVQGGFSGTPVWDEQLNSVVGIVTAAESDSSIKAAFMIPTDELIAAWPALAAHSLAAGSRGHLQVRLTRLEKAQCQAANPTRFQSQIDTLRERLAKWDKRIKRQRERISEGLDVQRQQLAAQRARREKRHLRVVGSPPLDVTDYFKDRRQDLRKLGQLLSEPTTRLVSVIGHGGMGKTALACKVLRDLEHQRWPYTDHDVAIDGIVYLSTRTTGISLERLFLDCTKLLEDEERERLRTVWTNPQLKTADKISRLLETLRQGRYVILLDNLEDLLDDQGRFTDEDLRLFFEQDLLRAPGTQLVVTTRIPLALHREIMRFDQKMELLEGLPADEGVALLRELDPNGEYGLRDAPEAQLKKAVELTHGVPRALEVLAGILANDPFATLDEVLETFYTHEDVVQALIEEHYKRLDREARRVVEALAVFRKPVPPLAVDFLLEPFEPGLNVPSIVQRFIHASIVTVNRTTKTVTLHPIDQDYAYNQLPEEDETDTDYTRQALERRAANYYVQLRTLEATWQSIEDLEPQLNEFRHLVEAEDYDKALKVIDSIDETHLYLWGHYGRIAELRKKLLGQFTSRSRMVNLHGLARSYAPMGKTKEAKALYKTALAIACEIDDRKAQGELLNRLGEIHRELGNMKQALRVHKQALAIAQEIGDHSGEGWYSRNLGLDYFHLGKFRQAIELYEEGIIIARKTGDRWMEESHLRNLGYAYFNLGGIEQAVEFYQQALTITHEIRDQWGESAILELLGLAYKELGQHEKAIENLKQALLIAEKIGNQRSESTIRGCLGVTNHDLGKIKQALRLYYEAFIIAHKISNIRMEGYLLGDIGFAYYDLGKIHYAIELLEEALAISKKIGDCLHESIWLGNLGKVHYSNGDAKLAISLHREALTIVREIGYRTGEHHQLLGISKALLSLDQLTEAQSHCEKAMRLNVPETDHQVKLMIGIIHLNQDVLTARSDFLEAVTLCRTLLAKKVSLYAPQYTLATALVGQAVCNPHWTNESHRPELLDPVLKEYRRALDIAAAPGIVQDAIRDLELIQAAGVEGLEPVFDLLENAEYEPDIPEDLPDLDDLIG